MTSGNHPDHAIGGDGRDKPEPTLPRLDHEEIFEHDGLRFRVYFEPDDTNEPPWMREDGHGPVRHVARWCGRVEKRAGERIIHVNHPDVWLYDWQAACKMARSDGWDTDPIGAPNRVERAVQADCDRMRQYLQQDWYYVGVCVAVVDEDDDDVTNKYHNALWGIESDAGEYLTEVAHELAAQAAELYREKHKAELKAQAEAVERASNACRYDYLSTHVHHKDCGSTVNARTGHIEGPMYRRWYIDCPDLTATTLGAALDSMMKGTEQ